MKRLLLILISLFLLMACGNKNDLSVVEENVEESQYNRVVILNPAVIEMMYLLGVEDKIVGISTLKRSKVWPEDKVSQLETVGEYINPSVEKIMSLEPDLIIAATHTSSELDNVMSANNVKVIRYEANTIQQIFDNFRDVARLFGKSEKAEEIISEKEKMLEEISELTTEKRKGLFLLSTEPIMGFGVNTLPNDIMKVLNVENIAEGLEGDAPILSAEYILQQDPDIVIVMAHGPAEVQLNHPQLQEVTAFKYKQFVPVDSGQILRGSPLIIDNIKKIYDEIQNLPPIE